MNSTTTLFTAHATENQVDLIQYNKHIMNERLLAVGYLDAARRLRDSYKSRPWDDVILLPYLFVCRQAIELQLKSNIRELATLRRSKGDSETSITAESVDERMIKIGHRLSKLINEHDEHSAQLMLQEIPVDVRSTLIMLANLDNRGTGFRYSGVLEAPSANLNFRSLGDALDEAFNTLSSVIDAATCGEGV